MGNYGMFIGCGYLIFLTVMVLHIYRTSRKLNKLKIKMQNLYRNNIANSHS